MKEPKKDEEVLERLKEKERLLTESNELLIQFRAIYSREFRATHQSARFKRVAKMAQIIAEMREWIKDSDN